MIGQLKMPLSICKSGLTQIQKHISGKIHLGPRTRISSTASWMLLTEVRLHLRGRLIRYMKEGKHVIMLHSSCEE